MKVSDLISALQLQDQGATVVLHDQRRPGWISNLGLAEVQPVRLRGLEEFGVVWLQLGEVGEAGTCPGVALGSLRADTLRGQA
jgi:hypothetical protein